MKARQRIRPDTDPRLRTHYALARARLGAQHKGRSLQQLIGRLSPRTTFCWEYPTFQRCIRVIWEEFRAYRGPDSRQHVMLRIASRVFGITQEDFTKSIRDIAISHPRMIAVAMLRQAGLTYKKIGKVFHLDYKSMAYCCEQMQDHIRWLDDPSFDYSGPSFIRQRSGRVSFQVPATTQEDVQEIGTGSLGDRGRLDGGEGQTSGDPCQPHR